MSKTRLAGALAAAVCLLAAACWMVTSAFPLQAAPQVVTDGAGVSVDVGGAAMMHRSAVSYPEAARAKGIEGTVVLQARLDAGGSVVDASVLSGPQELRRAAIEAVLQWHFMREYGGGTQQVSIDFKLPKMGAALPDAPDVQAVRQQMLERLLTAPPPPGTQGAVDAVTRPTFVVGGGVTGPAQPPQIRSIRVVGLPESAQNELLASLPVREGDVLTPENRAKILAAVRRFDEHLSLSSTTDTPGQAELRILAPGVSVPARVFVRGANATALAQGPQGGVIGQAVPGQVDVRSSAPGASMPERVRVGGDVQGALIVRKVSPMYPPLAKQARIQGKVVLNVVLAKDGKVQNIAVESGHALLIQAALDAVRQWEYRPYLLNGNPVEVSTQVEVNFALDDSPPPAQP